MASGRSTLHSWPFPEETDTPDVAADIEQLVTSLDGLPIVLAGVLASRPSATTVPVGSIYDATDVALFYMSNGTGWFPITDAIIPTLLGTVTVTFPAGTYSNIYSANTGGGLTVGNAPNGTLETLTTPVAGPSGLGLKGVIGAHLISGTIPGGGLDLTCEVATPSQFSANTLTSLNCSLDSVTSVNQSVGIGSAISTNTAYALAIRPNQPFTLTAGLVIQLSLSYFLS